MSTLLYKKEKSARRCSDRSRCITPKRTTHLKKSLIPYKRLEISVILLSRILSSLQKSLALLASAKLVRFRLAGKEISLILIFATLFVDYHQNQYSNELPPRNSLSKLVGGTMSSPMGLKYCRNCSSRCASAYSGQSFGTLLSSGSA